MTPSALSRLRDKILYDVLGHVPRNRPFLFGIGLSKTGTTSLNDALEILGYSAFHLPPIAHADAQGQIRSRWPWWVYKYDALTDLTVSVLHAELRETFPNARFIHTRRPLEKWLDSCRRHFTAELGQTRIAQGQAYLNDLCDAFYGSHIYDEAGYRAAYERHEREVMALHGGQPGFMDWDLTQGDGWAPLCAFLGKPVPEAPFPVSNKGRKAS
ncbi:sulfotransferase family protein [uncultured Roseobacter sp.]|uniref:sulfotransferase family protein n=1 Tax=uncultured Roseobacter sp. TaxID=114847 RepID=UPI00260B3461|nr:sulfotransferase family protein [uncultured Roseobacter sp.]